MLLLIWAVATGCNLFKPFHIDDTAHLEISKWIALHPLHPMSGILNWTGQNLPISATNQPHLYFALMAVWGLLFGYSEVSMHVLESFFALGCIVLFYRIASDIAGARHAVWATMLCALGPAFLVEQNAMVDIPLLFSWLGFFWPLTCGNRFHNQRSRYLVAALFCAGALLIKYSSLILLVVLVMSLVLERRARQAWVVLLPVGTLLLWSAFNYYDYGAVHILGRPGAASSSVLQFSHALIAWTVGVGGLLPLGLICIGETTLIRRAAPVFYTSMIALFLAVTGLAAWRIVSQFWLDTLVWWVFFTNGVATYLATGAGAGAAIRALPKHDLGGRDVSPKIYLVLWIAGTMGFYCIFPPFMAARHVLPGLPPIIILATSAWGQQLLLSSRIFALVLTAIVSTGLGVCDWRFAAFGRHEAIRCARDFAGHGTLWTLGHWGWQWYATRSGMTEVDVENSPLRPGEFLVVPREFDAAALTQPVSLHLVRTDTQTMPWLNILCTGRNAAFYAYMYLTWPWSISLYCQYHIDIYRIEAK